MFGLIKRMGGLFIIVGFLFLTACGGTASKSPTPDPALIYTSAAQTVEAELTLTAETNPATATITAFPLITETSELPTAILGNGGVLPTLPGPQTTDISTTLPGEPTLTQQVVVATLPQSQAADKATWISNDPPDSALVVTDAKFDITWQMKNTGTTTWTTMYTIRHFSGNIIMKHTEFHFRNDVKPGDTGTFIVDAVAPSKPGTYNTWWKMTNALGQNFGDMSLTIIVIDEGKTPTAAPTSTESP